MPGGMQCAAPAKEIPEHRQKAENVSDDRAGHDAGHPHRLHQNQRKQNIPDDLEAVGKIVRRHIPVCIDHLRQIEDHHGEGGIQRYPAIVGKGESIDLSRDAGRPEYTPLQSNKMLRINPCCPKISSARRFRIAPISRLY